MYMYIRTVRSLLLVVGFVLSVPFYASAVDTIVNTSLDRFGSATYGLMNMQIQVTYHATTRNLDTGSIVASGDVVPQGADILFSCGEHTYQDIYWFSSGYNADSPYGDWVPNAGNPGNLCQDKNYVPFDGRTEGHQGLTYATFSVNPPVRTISGLPATCTTYTDGVSKVCRDVTSGTLTATCHYAATHGIFYGVNGLLKTGSAGGVRFGGGVPSSGSTCTDQSNPSVSSQVPVPAAQIAHTIVVDSTGNGAPTAPNITLGGGACVVGEQFSFTVQGSDPDGDSIRYAIDWNSDGVPDQYVPATGYVPSGTSQTVTRVFATSGQKTVQVRTEDSRGLVSGWSTSSFTCAAAVDTIDDSSMETGFFDGDTSITGDSVGAGVNDLQLRAIPSLVSKGSSTRLHWSAVNVDACVVSGTNGDSFAGITSVVRGQMSGPIEEATRYTLTCTTASGESLQKSVLVNIIPVFREI